MKDEQINLRVSAELKKKLEMEQKRLIKALGFELTLSQVIRMLLNEKLEGK